MLALFKTNQIATSFLLVFYIALLHFAPFVIEDNWEPSSYGVAAAWIYEVIGYKGLNNQILLLVLLFFQALILIFMDLNHKLSKEGTLFSGVFLILFSSLTVPYLHLSPTYFSNIFLLLAINQVLITYRVAGSSTSIFNAGFFIGVAALFCPAYLIFLIWIFAGLNLLRGFKFKERILVITGAITVFLLTGTYYFWQNDLSTFIQVQFIDAFSIIDLRQGNDFTFIHLSLLAVLVLFVVASRFRIVGKKTMQVQKKIDVFYWGLLISAVVVLFQSSVQESNVLVIMPFLGLFVGMLFTDMKKNIAELLHFVLLAIILLLQYRPFFLL